MKRGARRQKWIDQAQSLNIYIDKPSGKKIDDVYKLAWMRGLKTTYYCRTLGASDAEKSTVTRSTLNAVNVNMSETAMVVNVCPIDDPSCEACQ